MSLGPNGIKYLGLLAALVGVALIAGVVINLFVCPDGAMATVYATLLAGLATASVVLWQGSLIKEQIQFQSYLELEREWNSPEMIDSRRALAQAKPPIEAHLVEDVFEFLEKFGLFKRRNAIDMDFIRSSSIGFCAVRYYFYFKENIEGLRRAYKTPDLYMELEKLYDAYLISDGQKTTGQRATFEKNLVDTKSLFLTGETH